MAEEARKNADGKLSADERVRREKAEAAERTEEVFAKPGDEHAAAKKERGRYAGTAK